jgi:hypothetical protein
MTPRTLDRASRAVALAALVSLIAVTSVRLQADTGSCPPSGQTVTLPFTDVTGNFFFCAIASAFFSGLTNGTTPTTYSPSQNTPREQMAAFVSRTLDQSLRRGSRRAALGQWWTPRAATDMAETFAGNSPFSIQSDGLNLWVADFGGNHVLGVSSLNGVVTSVWAGIQQPVDLVVARGLIYVLTEGGSVYTINSGASGLPPLLLTGVPPGGGAITFDGSRLWTTSPGSGSISAIKLFPSTVDTFDAAFSIPVGMVYDGAHLWVTDVQPPGSMLKKVDITTGAVLQTITLPNSPGEASFPCFDGTNIWVPGSNNKLYVVRVKDNLGNPLPLPPDPLMPFVLATLTGNGLATPLRAAFDGERVLVTNGNSPFGVSLWKAADLTPLGSITTPAATRGVCSDGLNFWFTEAGRILRF